MNLTEQSKEDITDMVIESRDVGEDDLTTAYLKGYADAEEKYRKKIKELEDDLYSANCIIADLTDSIPVQKVKDKIEELKEHYNTDNNIRIYTLKGSYELQVAVLQELLEDK